jgi:hypothetical protein
VRRAVQYACSALRGATRAAASVRFPAWAALLIFAHGCATEPRPAQLMQVGPQAAAIRELQTRRIGDVSEAELLAAAVGVLQDLGFSIMASDAQLGLVTGIKRRSPEEVLADIGRVFTMPMGPHDSFGVVLATRRVDAEQRAQEMRATFYQGWAGGRYAVVITSPTLYQRFFELVSATLTRTRSGN